MKTTQEIYFNKIKRGYCSPWLKDKFKSEGFDVSKLKLTEEVLGKPKKPKKNKGKSDYFLDMALGRC